MKWLLYWLFAALLVASAFAVDIETATYRIDCEPESATIKFGGFLQTCEYTLKSGYYVGDVAFCFDTQVSNVRVLFYLSNGSKLDVTSLFKYKKYQMFKGDCYYVENIVWNATVSPDTALIDIWYMPNNLSKSPKWDTYFGDVSTNRIDLMLDPLFNTSLYRIGRFNESSYWWQVNGTDNTDILFGGAYITESNITNIGWSNVSINYSLSYGSCCTAGLGNKGIRITPKQDILLRSIRHPDNLVIQYNYTLTSDGGVYISNATITGMSNLSNFSNYQLLSKGVVYRIIVDSANLRSSCYGDNEFVSITSGVVNDVPDIRCAEYVQELIFNPVNITNKSSSILLSQNISLPLLVNNFRLNGSFIGSVMVNITFDDVNFTFMNLSNSNLIQLNDSVLDNDLLSYKLYLGANTAVSNFSVFFNGLINRINITIRNELTNNIIMETSTVTMIDLTNPFIATQNTSVGSGNYTINDTFTSQVLLLSNASVTVCQPGSTCLVSYVYSDYDSTTNVPVQNTITALSEIPNNWLLLIVVIIAAVVLVGIVMRYMSADLGNR